MSTIISGLTMAYDFVDMHWEGMLAGGISIFFVGILGAAVYSVFDRQPHPAHNDPDHQQFKENIVELQYKLD